MEKADVVMSPKKMSKDVKGNMSGKESKADKHKKDTKNVKGKSVIEEPPQEDIFAPDFPETCVFASFADIPLTKISAHTEMVKLKKDDEIESLWAFILETKG